MPDYTFHPNGTKLHQNDDGSITLIPIQDVPAIIDDTVADNAPTAGVVTRSASKIAALLASVGGAALSTVARVAVDRSALGSTAIAAIPVYLMEGKRKGWFTHYTASEYSAEFGITLSGVLTADTAQGVVVSDGAGGAWVRQFEGPVNPQWWGWTLGTGTATVNNAAFTAMAAALSSRAYVEAGFYQAVDHIRYPRGYAEVSQTMDFNFGSTVVEGQSTGAAGPNGTIIAGIGCTVFRAQRTNTSGASGAAGSSHAFADGIIFRGFTVYGDYSSTEAENHAFHIRCRATIENVAISNMAGDGIFWDATSGGNPEGNVNASIVRDVRIHGCRDLISTHGADGNACWFSNLDLASGRRWLINEQSFLGNSYNNVDLEAGGIVLNSPPTQVSYSGNRYAVIFGQDTGASTNAPSGTTADNTWWYYIGTGAANTGVNIPNWLSGTTYRAGGAICHKSINGRSTFTNCYFEGGQSLPQIDAPAVVIGGILAETKNIGTAAFVYSTAGGLVSNNHMGKRVTESTTGQPIIYTIGDRANALLTQNLIHPVYAPLGWRWELGVSGNKPDDYSLSYGGGNVPVKFTGPATTEAFGRTVIQAQYANLRRIAIGSTASNARIMDYAASSPTSGNFARGEIIWNLSPSASGKMGWCCVTAGWIATAAWTASHAYKVGDLATNDTGKSYLCTTAGTSASSGGPTGTSTGITDGTAVWAYSAGFTFKPFGAIDA